MTLATFIDANVPIYVSGSDHPLKGACVRVLDLVASSPSAFFTNAEVLQEILHRYRSLGRWSIGMPVFEQFAELMSGRIEPVFASDVQDAALLADANDRLSSRDLVHLAVMNRVGAMLIISADRAFDAVTEVRRLDPTDLDFWREEVAPS